MVALQRPHPPMPPSPQNPLQWHQTSPLPPYQTAKSMLEYFDYSSVWSFSNESSTNLNDYCELDCRPVRNTILRPHLVGWRGVEGNLWMGGGGCHNAQDPCRASTVIDNKIGLINDNGNNTTPAQHSHSSISGEVGVGGDVDLTTTTERKCRKEHFALHLRCHDYLLHLSSVYEKQQCRRP